ncbi:glycine-rich domain-containing protein [Aeromonas dhakensis]|uniref:glycine-rich domain-containing protein n=1 Tax=Aeromonas dhakensis TaxID=196024 RepID=UPI003EC59F8E
MTIFLDALPSTIKYPALKPSIQLFDINPGTRQITLQPGTYRVAVVGGGGGGRNSAVNTYYYGGGGGGYDEATITVTEETVYSYTVGVAGAVGQNAGLPGGTSSFGSLVSATGGLGGENGQALGGVGQAGTIRTRGGSGQDRAGGSAAHRFGDGRPGFAGASPSGGGFSTDARANAGGRSLVDGWGLGLLPNEYGYGAEIFSGWYSQTAGFGGGGCGAGSSPSVEAYVGGGGGGQGRGGGGAVIVERLA